MAFQGEWKWNYFGKCFTYRSIYIRRWNESKYDKWMVFCGLPRKSWPVSYTLAFERHICPLFYTVLVLAVFDPFLLLIEMNTSSVCCKGQWNYSYWGKFLFYFYFWTCCTRRWKEWKYDQKNILLGLLTVLFHDFSKTRICFFLDYFSFSHFLATSCSF